MRASIPAALALALVVAGCAKKDAPADTSAAMAPAPATPAPPPPPKAIALADVAGTWNTVAHQAGGTDTTAVKSTLTATADTTGWTMTFPNRKPVKMHVKVDGDSIMLTSEPYESVLRKGVKVWTQSVHRMQGPTKLAGVTTAHYSVKTADSVITLNSESTKAP